MKNKKKNSRLDAALAFFQPAEPVRRPADLDLFGEIPVTLREIELWLFIVPRLPHYHRARLTYPEHWHVVEKLRRQKAAGTLNEIFMDECCEFCGQTLAADPDGIMV